MRHSWLHEISYYRYVLNKNEYVCIIIIMVDTHCTWVASHDKIRSHRSVIIILIIILLFLRNM